MSRSNKHKNFNKDGFFVVKNRKMKPYCLTGEKRNIPAIITDSKSYENYENIGDAKKQREDIKILKKTEKHSTRQQSKKRIRKDLENL